MNNNPPDVTSFDVPDWIQELVTYWRGRLFLGEWSFDLLIDVDAAETGEYAGADAQIKLTPDIRHARIMFPPATVTADPEADFNRLEHNVIHELLHARLAGATEFILQDLHDWLPSYAFPLIDKVYRREVEVAIDLLAHSLGQLARQLREAENG